MAIIMENHKMIVWKVKIHIIAQEIFQYSLITYLILQIAEIINQGFVSNFFNINILLILILVCGIIMVITNDENNISSQPQKITSTDIQNIVLMSFGGAFLVYVKTQNLGKISILISFITAIIIFLISILSFTE